MSFLVARTFGVSRKVQETFTAGSHTSADRSNNRRSFQNVQEKGRAQAEKGRCQQIGGCGGKTSCRKTSGTGRRIECVTTQTAFSIGLRKASALPACKTSPQEPFPRQRKYRGRAREHLVACKLPTLAHRSNCRALGWTRNLTRRAQVRYNQGI